jgi:predicted DCC family thiol-disulfide oxidoreductase YuxK
MTTAAAVENKSSLPGLAERPDGEVVLYDGHCRICTTGVRQLARWDTPGRLAFVSLHDPLVAERYPELSYDALMRDMYLIDRQGHAHRGAEAFRYLSRKLPWLWPLAPVLNLPGTMPIWQWMYRQIANRRYRFGKLDGCDNGACSIHRR